jgi:Salt stress response/antifungal
MCLEIQVNNLSFSISFYYLQYRFDQCFLRYSNTNFFSTIGQVLYGYCNLNDVTNPPLYNTILKQLMNTLITQAVNNRKQLFATGFINSASSSKNLYGLVQCTQDLSKDDCYQCLQEFVRRIPDYCYGKFGGRLLGTTCSIRYESYMFYNDTSASNEGTIGKSVLFFSDILNC